jgi:hypothetical protein
VKPVLRSDIDRDQSVEGLAQQFTGAVAEDSLRPLAEEEDAHLAVCDHDPFRSDGEYAGQNVRASLAQPEPFEGSSLATGGDRGTNRIPEISGTPEVRLRGACHAVRPSA